MLGVVLIMGVNGEPLTAVNMALVLHEARPQLILPTHYDNLFQPLTKGLALMPGLDLEDARRAATTLNAGRPWRVLDYGQTIVLPRD